VHPTFGPIFSRTEKSSNLGLQPLPHLKNQF
jgi:hypothetical protein